MTHINNPKELFFNFMDILSPPKIAPLDNYTPN